MKGFGDFYKSIYKIKAEYELSNPELLRLLIKGSEIIKDRILNKKKNKY